MVKINSLEIENIKRVKAVKLEPTQNGLTVIGGKNKQGKTSVLDAIAWALGGDKFKPSDPQRKESITPPNLHIVLSNGLIVERKGVNSALKVIDPEGNKGGQQILNSFVEQLALDLPKFLNANNKEKAETLLRIVGIGDKLHQLETEEQRLFNQRHEMGRICDRKKKYAEELESYPGLPKELVSASELIRQQQDILARNGENARKRQNIIEISKNVDFYKAKVERLTEELAQATNAFKAAQSDLAIAQKSALDLHDESTEELEKNINDIDNLNTKIRANLDKEKAEMEAEDYGKQYDDLTTKIEDIRKAKTSLLDGANLPLPDLSVEDGELTYQGVKWDCMATSDQLKVSTAIVRRLNPDCGFVLMDKLEQLDTETLKEFSEWLEQEQLQVIATRVSSGSECQIIIEDGYIVQDNQPVSAVKPYKAGEF